MIDITHNYTNKRDILVDCQSSCSFGCGREEIIAPIFFESLLAWIAWREVLRWLSFLFVPHNCTLHIFFLQFAGINKGGRVIKDRLHVIWFMCNWEIWKRRNEKVFEIPDQRRSSIIYDIQETSWKWLKSKVRGFCYTLNHFILNSKEYIGR